MNAHPALLILCAVVYIAACAGIAILTRKHPAHLAGLMAAAAPLEKVSFHAGITVKPFLILLPGFVLGTALFVLHRTDSPRRLTRFEWMLAILMAVGLISLVGALAPMRGLRMWIQLGFLAAIAASTARVLTGRKDIAIFFQWFLLGSIPVLGYGLVQLAGFFSGFNGHLLLPSIAKNPTLPQMLIEPGSVVFSGGRRMVRLSSFFFDWNFYGAYLVAVGSLLAARAGERIRMGTFTIPGIYSLMVAGVCLFLTFSRSAWLGALASIVVLWWLRAGVRAVLQRYILFIAAFFMALVIFRLNPLSAVADRLRASVSGDPSTIEHAIYGWAALRMMLDHPIFGIGLHNFAPAYQALVDPHLSGATAHSSFLSLAAEMGLVGVTVFVWFFLEVAGRLYAVLQIHRESDRDRWIVTGVLAALVGVAAAAVFYHLYTQPFIWSLLGAAWAIGNVFEGNDVRRHATMQPRNRGVESVE